MDWLVQWIGGKPTTQTIAISGKSVELRCSARAGRELARRERLLIVEVELAFACFARKQMHFHEMAPGRETISVNAKLALLFTKIVPNSCDPATPAEGGQGEMPPGFVPSWIELDYVRGGWRGDYGL
ncbi:MAG: hypothetical protein HY850_11055 [Betaproteobacteria bacterium]|nr:hypothetical protein [Betaproteobacteria bacterium]